MAALALYVLVFGFLSATAQMLMNETSQTPQLDMQVTAPSENQEMIAMNCTVEPGLSELIRIEVKKKRGTQQYIFINVVPVGSIDAYQGIQSHNSKIIVEGHLDKTGWTMSYLSVTILRYECTDDGLYYCIATGSRSRLEAEVDVTICNNVTELTQVTPDATNPTNSVITCRLRTNQKIKSISFIGISWSKRSTSYDKNWSVVVFANSSLNDGLASTGPAFSENIMKISGNINQSNPEKSQLVVEFPSETCQDSANETFACVIRYSDSDSSSTHLARAELAALKPCSSGFPEIRVSQGKENDPTRFSVNCPEGWSSSSKFINLEISLIPDIPSVLSSRRHIAYYNRFSPSGMPTMNPDLAKKGVSVSRPLDVYFSAGTCEDTGVYRCKRVYQSTGEAAVKVVLSEARLPPCLPGAVASVERSYPADGPSTETLVCRVDSLRVVVLVSLEVSVVRNGTRRVLAYINSFLNKAKVSHESSDVRVVGEIHPYNPAASSLNVTSELTSFKGVSLYITTCTAVYSGNETKGIVVNSMVDARVLFKK